MSLAQLSDVELVEQMKGGSIDAFEEIVHRFEAKGFNLAMRLTRNQEDAEEVLQDVFATIYTKIEGFRGQSAFSSWLYRIIVNAAFMKLRKRKQNQTISLEDLAPAVRQQYLEQNSQSRMNNGNAGIARELRTVLDGAINRLPEQYRLVFVLRDVDGLSNQEVSEVLDLTIPAVKSRLHRSRMMLRRRLRHYYGEFVNSDKNNVLPSALAASM